MTVFWQQLIWDHLIIHWIICLGSVLFDEYIRRTGKWNRIKRNPERIPDTVFNILSIVIGNQIFVTFPLFYFFAESRSGYDGLIHMSNLYRFPIAFLVLEFLFYHVHRYLHDTLYEEVHYIHHRWISPMAISATYAHPIEHALGNVMPVIIAAKFAGFNEISTRVWQLITLSHALIGAHGGYRYGKGTHDKHHRLFNCNYGTIGLLDWWYGTSA